jgi:sec-independent protein translocase protein TatA
MSSNLPILAFFSNLGMPELIVIGLVALLLFGRRLPEVGRSLGKGIVEFKKGLRDVEEEVTSAGESKSTPASARDKSSNNAQPPGPSGTGG